MAIIHLTKTNIMTYFTKKITLTGIFCLIASFGLQAQIISLQYRAVASENVEEFIHRETTYWAPVAKKAIADGNMVAWELWERVGGWDMDDDTPNFVFVNVFADAKSLDNMNAIWSVTSEVHPNMRMSDMETQSMSRTVHALLLQGRGAVGETGNYAVVNYSKVSNMDKFLELETQVWQPYITNAINTGKTNFKGWSLATLLSPRGPVIPFNGMSVDQFDTYSDALMPTIDESLPLPNFEGYEESHTRQYIAVYRLVAKEE